jgi:hypothetical protein
MVLLSRLLAEAGRWREVRRLYGCFVRSRSPEERGRRLLRQWLSPEQRAQFDALNYFEVVGSDTGRRFRIQYGSAANVGELNEAGRLIMGWCFVPRGQLVPGDVMLAQKIALETNETAALAVANRFSL